LLWNKTLRPYFRIEWLIYSQTIAYLLTALCVYFTVLTKVKQRFSKIEFSFIKKIIRSSLPYALLFLLMSMSLRIDSVLLERLLPNGDVQAGIYAQAYRLLDAACQLGYLVAGLLLPIFAKLIYDKAKLKQIVEFSAPILLIPACIIVFILFVYRNQVMQLLYHNHIESSVTIFSILILSFIPISASYIYGTLLTANGNIKAINIIAFAGVIVNIGLNIVLIPVFQAKGSAIANLATQLVTCLAQLVLAQRLFKLKIIYKRTLFFIVIMIIVGLIISNLLIYWVLGAVITATVSIIIAFGLKVLNLKSIYEILRYKEL
jgi:O-antigen/teichoic acid export membrane protein